MFLDLPSDVSLTTVHGLADLEDALSGPEPELLFYDLVGGGAMAPAMTEALCADHRLRGIPLIAIADRPDPEQALTIFRTGVAEILDASDFASDALGQAIVSAATGSMRTPLDREAALSNALARHDEVRLEVERNMRLLRSEMAGLMTFAWRGVEKMEAQADRLAGQRLAQRCRLAMAIIDDTTLASRLDPLPSGVETVELGALVVDVVDRMRSAGDLADANVQTERLPALRVDRAAIDLLLGELLTIAAASARLGRRPTLVLRGATDGAGRPIVFFEDDGLPLSARQQSLSGRLAVMGGAVEQGADPMIWSLCQRLAERNGIAFRILPEAGAGVRIALRFGFQHRVPEA